LAIRPLRLLVQTHRWLGIAMCLMFALWFATGAVMIYVPFPSLAASDRIDAAPLLDVARLSVTPAAAIAAAGVTADRLRLIEQPDRPVYVVAPAEGTVVMVAGDSGAVLPPLNAAEAARVAGAFARRAVRAVDGPFDYDQWVVHQQFDRFRPFYRVELDDPDGAELYVSARSGEVRQRTLRGQRVWNYLGAVIHWIYPTILRKSWLLWDNTVWYLALVGIVMALSGITLGLIRSVKSLRKGRSVSPFRGWFRWHHVTGLGVGVFLLTWIFSGWLSMDHERLFTSGVASADQIARYRGVTLGMAADAISLEMIGSLGPVAEAEIVALGGRAYVIGRRPMAVAPVIHGGARDESAFTDAELEQAVRAGWPGVALNGVGGIPADDSYGHLITDPLPATTRRVTLGDEPPTWIHIDAASGEIIQVMDRSRRIYRWLFSALHTFDFPGLSGQPLLRQAVMLSLLALGFLLSVTGMTLGIRRLRRSL
jgi:uncharacterized iron-regulated membrane protein